MKKKWQSILVLMLLYGGYFAYQRWLGPLSQSEAEVEAPAGDGGSATIPPLVEPGASSGRTAEAPAPAPRSAPAPGPAAEVTTAATDAAIVAAFRAERSGLVFESGGRVKAALPDDNEGSRHQRFILELSNGHTVLVSHNIDLAPRIPLREGERVTFRGQYEWNDRGGVIHWTHHDPQRRREGGWIDHSGKRYE